MPEKIPTSAACDYCHLPIPNSLFGRFAARAAESDSPDSETPEPQYCCLGCRIASSVTSSRGASGEAELTLTRLGIAIFLTMNVMVFAMALWSRDIYGQEALAEGSFEDLVGQIFRYLSMLFSLPVVYLLGKPVVENATTSLKRGEISTDLLIALGVAASFVYSSLSVLRGAGHIYFEVACMVLVLLTLGRWLEATGKLKTSEALEALVRLLPEEVRRVGSEGPQLVPRDEIAVNDIVRVLSHERFGVDGQIVQGLAEVDEQIVTGESFPISKKEGDTVLSGTLNVEGDVTIQVTAAAGEETLSRLLEMVRSARETKGRYQQVADRIAVWFVPSVCLLAAFVTVYHAIASGFESGIQSGLAVVLIACPCAVGLATPMAVWAAMGSAASRGVLFQGGEALERLSSILAVRFDKTGTLTQGAITVSQCVVNESAPQESILREAADLSALSNHPLARAVLNYSNSKVTLDSNRNAQPLLDFSSIPGEGIEARRQGAAPPLSLGSVAMMGRLEATVDSILEEAIETAREDAQPLTCFASQGRVQAVFVFQETLRDDAQQTLGQLQRMGLDTAILTGDHQARASRVADLLQSPVVAELRPDDKVKAIHRAQEQIGPVAMVGDGVNDAPALAGADVGIAMGCGADFARESADVCLLGNQLDRVPWAIDLSRKTVRVIKQNLFWAFAYNLIGIGLAASGVLNPIFAAVAMSLSSFFVVTNSLRLRGEETEENRVDEENGSNRETELAEDQQQENQQQSKSAPNQELPPSTRSLSENRQASQTPLESPDVLSSPKASHANPSDETPSETATLEGSNQ